MSSGRQPGGTRRKHQFQLFKTEMCKFYQRGQCDNGRSCSWAHSPDEIRRKPDLTNTSMCKIFAREGQCLDPECRFAHSEEELRATSGFFKMKMCGFAQTGRCKNGDNCRFAHSVEELRPPSQVLAKKPAGTSTQDPAQPQSMASHEGQYLLGMPGIVEDDQASTAQGPRSSGVPATAGTASSSGGRAPKHRSRWSDVQDSSSGSPGAQRSGCSGHNAQDGSDSAGSAEGGSQEGSSSRFSGHSSLTEVPRSDHTSTHSGTTTFTGESGNSGAKAGANKESSASAAGDSSGNSADATTASGSREQHKAKHKKRDQEQGWEKLSVNTLLITNVPTYLTQGALLSMFEDLTPSMRGKFDFFYCPWDGKASRNLGYATINFPSPASALEFQQEWSNKELCRSGHWQKRLRILKANVQGLQANLAYFSKVKVTEGEEQRFRPLFRDKEGLLNTLRLSDDAQEVLDPGNVPQPRSRARPAQTAAAAQQSPPPPTSPEESPDLGLPNPGQPACGKGAPPAGAGAPRKSSWQGDLHAFNVGVDSPMGAGGCGDVTVAQMGYPSATGQPLGPAPAQGPAPEAQDGMPWLPMMMMAVPGGAGGMPWQGMGEGQHELKGMPENSGGGYQTPELSETEARDAAFDVPGQQRVPPFQPMVPCMMMPMEAFMVPVDRGGYGCRGMSSGADEQGFAYSGATPPIGGDWQDPYNSAYS